MSANLSYKLSSFAFKKSYAKYYLKKLKTHNPSDHAFSLECFQIDHAFSLECFQIFNYLIVSSF